MFSYVKLMLDDKYIMQLIRKWASTPAGKAAIKKKTGLTYVDGDPSAELAPYGEEMKRILYSRIKPLIKSFEIDDIIVGKPYENERGIWSLDLSFKEGSLRRDSLDLENYPEGLENIVLLFARGYNAKNYTYGWWITSYGEHGHVRSRRSRPSNDFLEKAVKEFNSGMAKGFAKAELVGEYKNDSKD